jgi:hypothetical protein
MYRDSSVENTGAMSNQTATTGATGPAQNIVGGGLSPLGGGGISPGIPNAAISGAPTGGKGGGGGILGDIGGAVTHTGSFLEKLVSGLMNPTSGTKKKPKGQPSQKAITPPPASPPQPVSATGPVTAKPMIDPMAMKLFFSTIIGPYLDSIVQEQNQAADQLGAQMNSAMSDFSIPDNVRGLLQADSAQAQADIRNVAQTQRAAAASAPDLAAFMQQLYAAQTAQEQARLEQQRVLAAQATQTGQTDPAIQAIIDSLSGKPAGQ